MENKTGFLKNIDFDAKITKTAISTDPQNEIGRINNGPYLPIQSGTYNVRVICTSDFSNYDVIGQY